MSEYPMDDLEIYRQVIKSNADAKSPEILPNAGPKHAAIAMTELFNHTKEHVRMVVGNFDGKVSDEPEYIQALSRCIHSKIQIDVIHLDPINPNSKAYLLLQHHMKEGKIRIHHASSKFCEKLTVDGKPKHFAVFDNDMFRFEKDTVNYVALFSFNDQPTASRLNSLFRSELS